MLQDLIQLHHEVMSTIEQRRKRFLHEKIHWESKGICILGARGVGKTTLICQFLLEKYKTVDKALYISGDNIHVLSKGLLNTASEYFMLGGEALFIDEVHKYPNWSLEVKNILDSFKKKQIIISGSSTVELKAGIGDLSRRVVYYELPGLSFREYLSFSEKVSVPVYSLSDIMQNHTTISGEFKELPILKYFHEYLKYGFYPYFLESREVYFSKLNQVIEKVITEDIVASKSIKLSTVLILKKLLWLIATSTCLVPNVDNISKDLQVTREVIYHGFDYLERAGLIQNVFPYAHGLKLVRKPGKIYLNNTNLLYAINSNLSLEHQIGSVRETFFSNQVAVNHSIHTDPQADFLVDQQYCFEVGGKNKNEKQIKDISESYLALDGMILGMGKRIPLYLFGLLY